MFEDEPAPATQPEAAEPDDVPLSDPLGTPLDWHSLFADDAPPEDWILEPLIAKGRGVAVYSAPKVGKSLLALEIAAAIASGGTALGQRCSRRKVVFVDMENDPRGDIRTRLEALGHNADDLAGWLIYHSFPTLAWLDSRQGGQQLLASIRHNDADLVVIDTVSRTVKGEEDSNDTWLGFYAHTGLPLKRERVSLLRLDHSGKDATKGQRGASAKGGDVDAVWRLTKISSDTFRLECEMARQLIPTRDLTLHRRTYPLLRHELANTASAADAAEEEIVRRLDQLQVPLAAGRDTCRKALTDAGVKVSTTVLAGAIRRRKDAETCPGQVAGQQLTPDSQDSERTATK